jgi:hypothetical protein
LAGSRQRPSNRYPPGESGLPRAGVITWTFELEVE